MSFKHLVTSGCSFSDNTESHWPHYLSKKLNLELHNRGMSSAGNGWICKSTIYQIQQLLESGITPEEILVLVMWSDIGRQDMFIDSNNPFNVYKDLLNKDGDPNPVNFIDNSPNIVCRQSSVKEDGYLLGGLYAPFTNHNIINFKKDIWKYFPSQSMAIQSYENFLRLQWLCEANGIALVNLTMIDIMHYPSEERRGMLTKDYFRNVNHLYKMVNLNKWIFWDSTKGLYEYTKDNDLTFNSDGEHPSTESHEHYVNNFLVEKLRQLVY